MQDEKRDRIRDRADEQPGMSGEPPDVMDLDTSIGPVQDVDDMMSSAMGGTSDAGTAADDAAESAALGIGLPEDLTRRTSSGPSHGAEHRASRRRSRGRAPGGSSGGHEA